MTTNPAKALDRVGDIYLRARARKILAALEKLPNGSLVLDCGAGKPFFAGAAKQSGIRLSVISADPDLHGLSHGSPTVGMPRVAANGFQLPFKDHVFDCIILSEVLEHVDDAPGMLREVARVLTESGLLLVTVPCQDYPLMWDPVNKLLESFTGRHIQKGLFAGIWAGHLRLYSIDLLSAHLREGGLVPTYVQGTVGWCLPFSQNLFRLGALLLYGDRLPKYVQESLDRFGIENRPPTGVTALLLRLTGALEHLNYRCPRRRTFVGLYAEARPAIRSDHN